jgi:hypothetical protein
LAISLGSRLQVEGDIVLSGAQCSLTLPAFFVGTYDILDWGGSFTGTFDVLPQLPGNSALVLDLSQLYVTGEITIEYKYAADFDTDADVDSLDFAFWTGGFGATGSATHLQGDADGDLDIDGVDFLTWQQQFGSDVTATAAAASVPEPAASRLLGVAILLSGILGRQWQTSGPFLAAV